MLHQPSKTFQPSSPATASFDPKAYIARARELGLTIFPTIFSCGKRTYGLTTPGQRGFSSRNLSLSTEFAEVVKATPDATGQVFDALCDDLGVDPDEAGFNAQVSALCRREDLRRQGDRKLLATCRRAEAIVAEDLRLENRLSELTDSFMDVERGLERPTAEGVCRFLSGSSSQEMRAELKRQRSKTPPEAVAEMTAYIKAFAAWEARLREAQDRHGITAAERQSSAAGLKTRKAICQVTAMEATTVAGIAAKSRVMSACLDAGYGYDSEFEEFAQSIFRDATLLEDDRPTERRRERRVGSEPCVQQVHH